MSHKFSLGQAVVFMPTTAKSSAPQRKERSRAFCPRRVQIINTTSKSILTALGDGLGKTSSRPCSLVHADVHPFLGLYAQTLETFGAPKFKSSR
jgi:hypothetical protein